MARKFDLSRLRKNVLHELNEARNIVSRAEDPSEYVFGRWICTMVAVHVHASWERYVENRLAAALNHKPDFFLETHDVRGVTNISAGFSNYIVRGGGRFFDFKSMSDLFAKGDDLLSKTDNPFRKLSKDECKYIDALASIRNFVAHGSEAANKSYRRQLLAVYSIKYPPSPGEFLLAKDNKAGSFARYKPRIYGLIIAVEKAVQNT